MNGFIERGGVKRLNLLKDRRNFCQNPWNFSLAQPLLKGIRIVVDLILEEELAELHNIAERFQSIAQSDHHGLDPCSQLGTDNQIVNQAATHFYRTGVPIPITVRLPSGGTPGSGPFHSQSMEGIYAQYPGLVVLTPASVSDAYHMLIDAVALDDPVIFCEHKFLYRWLKAKSIQNDHLPIGQARIVRPGKHATVVAYSAMVHEAVRAAERLHEDGWEIEVVDLRSVKPLDMDTVLASVARTGRLLAVGEAFPWGGVTAEVVARTVSEGFHLLDAPPQRLNARDTPVPYHPKLWAAHRPTPESIQEALRKLLNF